jgi:hypothetical protein
LRSSQPDFLIRYQRLLRNVDPEKFHYGFSENSWTEEHTMLLKNLKDQKFLVSARKEDIHEGDFILRDGKNTAHIARFHSMDDDAMILENVIDIKANSFITERGLLIPAEEDSLYTFNSAWSKDDDSHIALEIVHKWALFTELPRMQKHILKFITSSFAPAFIIYLKETDALKHVFIPVQQRLRIGRFSEKVIWEDLNIHRFHGMLEELIQNEHITYMGYLPQGIARRPMFFSNGIVTHLETDMKLKNEPFLYPSNCGGNIKFLKEHQNRKYFLVDAGASYKGNGVKSTLEEANNISVYLKKLYPEYRFIPVEGRGAIGSRFSF